MVMENMLAYAEIDEILNLLEDDYREKVPKKVRDFFKEEKMKDYHPEIDIEKPLIEQNLKRETMVLLAILNLNYWCENEKEKQIQKNTRIFMREKAYFKFRRRGFIGGCCRRLRRLCRRLRFQYRQS